MITVDQYGYMRTAHRVYGKKIRKIARDTGHLVVLLYGVLVFGQAILPVLDFHGNGSIQSVMMGDLPLKIRIERGASNLINFHTEVNESSAGQSSVRPNT